jgi:hypothetical protein
MVAAGFAVLFLLLRSRQYMAVDGALRCLGVFHTPSQHLHGNNHLLFPFWIWVWTRAVALAGWKAADWLAFIHQSQALNGIAAAAAIGLLCSILRSVAGTRFALLGALQFGLATAVVLHATNSAEPVVGLLFAIAALWAVFAALRAESKAALLLVGLLMALALASYQSMGLVAPCVALACVCWPSGSGDFRWRSVVTRLVLVGAGGLLSVGIIYGWAYATLGIPASKMVGRFLTMDGAPEVYGGFSISHLLNIPFGLIRNLYSGVPQNYRGIRSLLTGTQRWFWVPVAGVSMILLAIPGWLIATGIVSSVRRSNTPKLLAWCGILLCVISIGFPLFFWGPTYDKLWLLPLAIGILAAAFAFRFGFWTATRRRRFLIGLATLAGLEAAVNLPRAVEDHVRETAHLNEARDLASLVTTQDSVVVDFDDVSMLWLGIWGEGVDKLALPAVKRNQAMEWLASANGNTAMRHGKLLFVGVLDQDRTTWDNFLGRATGIGFDEFDCYRRESVIVRRYRFPDRFLTVRQFDGGVKCPARSPSTGQ